MHHLGVPGQRGRAHTGRLLAHPIKYIAGCIHYTATSGVRNSLQHNQIAEAFQEINGKSPGVVAGVDHRFNRAEQRCRITGCQCVDSVIDQCHVGDTEQRQRPGVVNPVALGACQQLVEHAERVTR